MEKEKEDFNPFGLEESEKELKETPIEEEEQIEEPAEEKPKKKRKKRRTSRVIKKETIVVEEPAKQEVVKDLRTKWVSPFKGAKKEEKKYFAVYTGRHKNLKLLPSVGKITPGKRFEVTLEMANVLRTSKDFRVTEIIAK